jgi:hypothetical protein
MDAVVLAAGKGSRLEGITPPFYKPLIPINGRAVIWTAVHHALQAGAMTVTVVVAPENALPISQVLSGFPSEVFITIQREPRGPGDALRRALYMAPPLKTDMDGVLVLMGDNVSTFADVQKIAQVPDFAIGVQMYDQVQCRRFTRWNRIKDTWVEGDKVPEIAECDPSTGMVTCWVGPFKAPRERLFDALPYGQNTEGEWKISPAFNRIGLEAKQCTTTTIDIGTPDTIHG